MADLRDLAATLSRFAAEIPAEDLPRFLGELETARALAWQRLVAPAPVQTSDASLLDARQAAERLAVRESWLRDHARRGRVPCVYVGRYMRFDLDRVRKALEAPLDTARIGL